jgi:hypothetical protein
MALPSLRPPSHDRAREAAFTAFARLLQPECPSAFLQDVWEQRPYLVARRAADHYADLLTLPAIDGLLAIPSAGASNQLALVKTQGGTTSTRLPPPTRSGILDVGAIYDAYADGYSVVLHNVGRRWPPLARFCNALEAELSHPVSLSLYLHPPAAETAAAQYAPYELFILQLAGAQTWRVHAPPVRLPLAPAPERSEGACATSLLAELGLAAGDLLYVPRGFPFEGRTGDTSSTYLALQVHVVRWADLLRAVITVAAQEDVQLRDGLPVGFLTSSETRAALAPRCAALLATLAERANLEAAVRRLGTVLLEGAHASLESHFSSLGQLDQIQLDTRVRRRTDTLRVFPRSPEVVTIEFPGRQVNGPAYLEPALRFIARTPAFAVRDLPDTLSDNAKLVLVRRLVRDGLLAIDALATTEEATHDDG